MTWIVATPTIFGYAVGISDICVQFRDGTARNCLLKLYPINRFLVAGFAGSVNIGFSIIHHSRRMLNLLEPDGVGNPEYIAYHFPKLARKVFYNSPEIERKLGSQILIFGVHPTVDMGISNWARSYTYKFVSPKFTPIRAKPEEVLSIGIGSGYEPYIQCLKEITRDDDCYFLNTEIAIPGGMGQSIAYYVTDTIKTNPIAGVSQNLHICIVKRGNILLYVNDTVIYEKDGIKNDIIMPEIASSPNELERIALRYKTNSESAIC